jgi:hypothetical protein
MTSEINRRKLEIFGEREKGIKCNITKTYERGDDVS